MEMSSRYRLNTRFCGRRRVLLVPLSFLPARFCSERMSDERVRVRMRSQLAGNAKARYSEDHVTVMLLFTPVSRVDGRCAGSVYNTRRLHCRVIRRWRPFSCNKSFYWDVLCNLFMAYVRPLPLFQATQRRMVE
jgi:hypothetical protein